ncbi:hypothetical protein LSAT2_020224 [Lamellibrachia satsuma]|nr:hypothetical protein LSAT2_020224 [Lamellibrachia satsuma]
MSIFFGAQVSVWAEGVAIVGLAQSVRENKEVEVKCNVSRVKPRADIYWRKGLHGSLKTGTTTHGDNSDGTYQLQSTCKVPFSRNDTHLYCLISRPGDITDVWATTSISVDVLYPPSTKVTQKDSKSPTQGTPVTLTCDITDGRPSNVINVLWKKGSTHIASSGPYQLSGRDLTIGSLDHSRDDGNYSCAAQNAAGTGGFSAKFSLLVNYNPSVSVVIPAPVVEGQSVTITCWSLGARPAVNNVTWKKGEDVIKVNTHTMYTGGTVQNPTLTIKLTTRTDGGHYTCQLSNDVGQGSSTVKLQVWSVNGNPAASWFYWRKQNSDFTKNTTTGVLSVIPSRVDESGKFSCVAGNWIGQSAYSEWASVTVQDPPETPTHFIVLNNSTSVALTLQWQPGLRGSHPPQVFSIQYMADTKPNLFHGRTITGDDSKQQQVTIAGLEPETLYKFTLYARSNNTDVIRSGVTMVSAWTTASPEVTLEAVDVQVDRITVTWSDTRQSSRRKRSTSTVVSVVIHYQRDGGEEGRYPPEGNVDVKQQSAVVSGQFDTEATYKVWLKVYEGQLTFPSKIVQPLETSPTTENKECSCSTVTVIAAVVGSLLLVVVLGLLVFGFIWRRRQQSNCTEGAADARDATKRQTPIEMSDDIRSSADVIEDTKQYQSLRDRAEEYTSNLRGTYASLDEPEAKQQPVPGRAYENVNTISQPKHTYVNTPVMCGDNADYAEVT